MKVSQSVKETPYRRNSYRENPKPSYYNPREEQKPSYNYIEETKIRIVQDNLVSVSGLPSQYDDPDLLADNHHFGKYGQVEKIIISSQGKHRSASIQVYITYEKMTDAAFAIKALDGIKIKGREVTATFGTTKYCTYFLKQNECRNEKCFYLHAYDTKNELMDGVKNNMDFLDQKSQNIITGNLRYYLEKELMEKEEKDLSQFPTIGETVQYLIEEQILDEGYVERLRKQILQDKKNGKTLGKGIEQDKTQGDKDKREGEKDREKQKKDQQKDKKQTEKSLTLQKQKLTKQTLSKQKRSKQNLSNLSNQTQDQRNKSSLQDQYQQINELSQIVNQLQSTKNKKCHSLSTTSSPTKYQKLTELESQTIDKTIERRIIKEIMRSNMIFRSKMDFVTPVPNLKEENNKIKNYVRKYLLNQI